MAGTVAELHVEQGVEGGPGVDAVEVDGFEAAVGVEEEEGFGREAAFECAGEGGRVGG